jgi:hypothetical protein
LKCTKENYEEFPKNIFASFVAMIIFSVLAIIAGFWMLTSVLQPEKPQVAQKAFWY